MSAWLKHSFPDNAHRYEPHDNLLHDIADDGDQFGVPRCDRLRLRLTSLHRLPFTAGAGQPALATTPEAAPTPTREGLLGPETVGC